MDNEGIKNSIIRLLGKDSEFTESKLNDLKENSLTIKDIRVRLDKKLEDLKISIIKSSAHLLVDKIHRGDLETSIKILDNTRDRIVFYDFLSLFDETLVLFEEYNQKLSMECSDILTIKNNLGINDHKIHKIIDEMFMD